MKIKTQIQTDLNKDKGSDHIALSFTYIFPPKVFHFIQSGVFPQFVNKEVEFVFLQFL